MKENIKSLYRDYINNKKGPEITYKWFTLKYKEYGTDYDKYFIGKKKGAKKIVDVNKYKNKDRRINLEKLIEMYKKEGPTKTANKFGVSNQLVHYYYKKFNSIKQNENENI